jgi:hypothetical protein
VGNFLPMHINWSLDAKSVPKLAMSKLFHLDKNAYALIGGNSKVDWASTRLYFTVQSQARFRAIAIKNGQQQQLHIRFRNRFGVAIPEHSPSAFVLSPMAELAY